MSAARTTFPTLAERPRTSWPPSLRVYLASALIEGDVDRVLCPHCKRPVEAEELHDFSALSVLARAAIGLDAVYQCAACFHLAASHGRLLHSDVANALGMHADVQLALAAGEVRAVREGHIVRTPLTRHLAPDGGL